MRKAELVLEEKGKILKEYKWEKRTIIIFVKFCCIRGDISHRSDVEKD